MKFCATHWEKLRNAIKGHGVFDLVPSSGAEAVSRLKDTMSGEKKTLERYDPLMDSHNMIVATAMQAGGPYIIGHNPDDPEGHYCPLCEVEKHLGAEEADKWIAGSSKAAADYAATLPRETKNNP